MSTSKLLNNSTSAESFLESLNLFSNSYRSEDNQELFQHFQRLKNYSKQNPILEDLCLTNKEFQLFEEECEAIEAQTRYLFYDNWVTVMKNDELFVQTFKGPDQFLARLKFNIKADPMQVFSVFYETDFMGDWIKTIKTSATIEETSIFRKKIQNIYNLPWPLVNRHSILNVRYFPLHEMKTILIISYTPKENFKNPNSNDKLIEMVLPSASTWIECLGNECNICIIFQANQFINSIPDWIVNFILRKSFSDMIREFRSLFPIFHETRFFQAMKKNHKYLYEAFAAQLKINLLKF